MSLELYAKSEHLIGIEESTRMLHDIYEEALEPYAIGRLLDIGCGNGALMGRLEARGIRCTGIDLSETQVARAKAAGFDAHCMPLCDVEGTFDAAVAVFDVLNFIEPEALEGFFACLGRVLAPGGIFIADVNTLHGFENVAQGTMCAEDEEHFLCVDAYFGEGVLETVFDLFSREADGRYGREQDRVRQYFHAMKQLRNVKGFALAENHALSLYDRGDKTLLIYRKKEV